MAIMASGLGGQRFSFRGYLPPDPAGREAALRDLEARSAKDGSTQLFIETPYRNDAMAASAARALRPDTVLCAAVGLSTPGERVIRMTAARWKADPQAIGKVPTVFLVSAAGAAQAAAHPDAGRITVDAIRPRPIHSDEQRPPRPRRDAGRKRAQGKRGDA
jgi:16S rRNA (cytidine1402-2'-O)-methyltransferase